MSRATRRTLQALLIVTALASFAIAFELFSNGDGVTFRLLVRTLSTDDHIERDRGALVQLLVLLAWFQFLLLFLLRDPAPWSDRPRSHRSAVLTIGVVSLLLHIMDSAEAIRLPEGLYGEDGIAESLTAAAFLVAGILLMISARQHRRQTPSRLVSQSLAGLALLAVIAGMEEISWGQRIFNWSTPTFVAEHNYQDETTLHNLFNPVLPYGYQFVGIVVATVLVVLTNSTARARVNSTSAGLAHLVPDRAYCYLAPLLVVGASRYFEAFEELCSLLTLGYSLDQINALREAKRSTSVTSSPTGELNPVSA